MTGESAAKIRLVRCPKCWQILPELPNIPVYACGNCGTRLRAKLHTDNAKSGSSESHESDSSKANKPHHESEDKESCSSINDAICQSLEECSSSQNNSRKDCMLSGNCNGGHLSHLDREDESHDNRKEQSESGEVHTEEPVSVASTSKVQTCEIDESENEECERKLVRRKKLPGVGQTGRGDQDKPLIYNCEQHENLNDVGSSIDLSRLEIGEPSSKAGEISDIELNNKSSVLGGANTEVDGKGERCNRFRKSDIDKPVTAYKAYSSVATSHEPAVKSTLSEAHIASPPEQLEQPEEIVNLRSRQKDSTDTFETADLIDPSSELSGTLIDLSKSPTTTSTRAYYEGGVSSNEGTDDQLSGQYRNYVEHAYKHANRIHLDERPRKETFLENRNSGFQRQLRNHTEEELFSIDSSKLHGDEFQDATRIHQPVRNSRLEGDEYRLLPTLSYRDGYESSNSSYILHDDFQYGSSFYPSTKMTDAYAEQELMKISRMAYGWEAKYDNYHPNERANRRAPEQLPSTWKDHRIPTYYDQNSIGDECFQSFNHPMYPSRHQDQRNWPRRVKFSRIPFSAEAINSRHQFDHSMCCYGPDFQYATQMHSQGLHHHSHNNHYGHWASCPSSPQRHMDSELSRGIKPADQMLKGYETSKYSRGKQRIAKRHLHPIAGGAPFITCHHCLKLLQIPQDFLLFKRKCHSLRCGACGKVLRYSLAERTQLIPYSPTSKAPPPSEVDEYGGAVDTRNLASTSPADECPVSCSDDCRLSFCPSCSTDRDPRSQSSFQDVRSNAVDRKASHNSHDHREKGKDITIGDTRDKHKNPKELYEPSGSSSGTSRSKKVSSEIEELAERGGSPLHRLMGYSSARALIYGFRPSSSGGSSSSYRPEV